MPSTVVGWDNLFFGKYLPNNKYLPNKGSDYPALFVTQPKPNYETPSVSPLLPHTLSVTLLKLNAFTRTPGITLLPKRCTVLRASTSRSISGRLWLKRRFLIG